jgi:gliding motility-associated protein GldL
MASKSFTQTLGWKKFMAKLYGIGASVVIVGALFKIMHWPGAGPMLILGLGTEAIIFLFSAFEPIHLEIDWTRVYPELLEEPAETPHEVKKGKEVAPKTASSVDKFSEMMEKAGLKQEVFEKLGAGINSLNTTASQLADISEASLATKEYTVNVKAAAKSAGDLSESYKQSVGTVNDSASALSKAYKQSAESLTYSSDTLSDSYSKVAQSIAKSGDDFSKANDRLAEGMKIDFGSLADGNKNYSSSLAVLNKNLSALNAIFELQLQEADLDKMMEDLNASVGESKKYAVEMTKLSKRLEALNSVYGNMLTAMNVNVKE